MDWSRVRALSRQSLDANWMLLLLVALHVATAAILGLRYDFPISLDFGLQLQIFASTYALVVGGLVLKRLAARPERPLRDLLTSAPALFERFLVAAPAAVAVSLFAASFSVLKSAIPAMASYRWDDVFADWDVAIHGVDAWKVIQPLVGYPSVTSALNLVYHFWFVLLYAALAVACALDPASRLRKQFLLAFVLCWALVGNLAATLLASVGPCFMLPMMGDPRYEGLMSYLRSVAQTHPLPALKVQSGLLHQAQTWSGGLGAGISAMPSMHVAMSVLIALLAYRASRWLGLAGVAFALTIMIGSVHLGYHYAVDGYVAVAMTLAIWALSGRLAVMNFPRGLTFAKPAPAFDR